MEIPRRMRPPDYRVSLSYIHTYLRTYIRMMIFMNDTYTYIYTHIHTYIHSLYGIHLGRYTTSAPSACIICIDTLITLCLVTYLPTYLPTNLPTYLPTYLTYLPTYIHIHSPNPSRSLQAWGLFSQGSLVWYPCLWWFHCWKALLQWRYGQYVLCTHCWRGR